ncbi:MAG: hypothetical protein IJA10_14005 [Lachnospiraceae bacterium]|nr:hypothetical protein [Lachnospiraceae bacterium]
MWNVMKSQIYQLKKDIMVFGATFFGFVITLLMNLEAFENGLTGSEGMAYMGESNSVIAGLLPIMVVVANVMGKDFADKTLHYEILSGHTRKEVFFGRLVVAILPGILCSFLTIISVPVVLTVINGWGNSLELNGVLIRILLIFITLIRIACEVAFLTILTKNHYLTYFLAYTFGMAQMLVLLIQTELTDSNVTPLLPVANCIQLLTFQDWSTFYLDETDQILYSSAVTSEMALWAIIPSIVIGGVVILLSYVFFKHDDLN